MPEDFRHQLSKVLPIYRAEWLAVSLAFAWFFMMMFSYQILRPIRESLVSELPTHEKSWLFMGTFGAMALAVPMYAKLVSLVSRRGLTIWMVNFFAINILLFAAWNYSGGGKMMIRCFFVWISVFSLYATSLVWSVLTDLFSNEQSKRLFGPIASGATIGAIAGSTLALQANALGITKMMLVAAGAMEACLLFAMGLEFATKKWPIQQKVKPLQGGVMDGFREIWRSRYLVHIILFLALTSYFGTTIYLQLTDVAKISIADQAERTSFFAKLNLFVQLGTLVTQALIVGPVMRWLGLSVALTLIPVVAAGCFLAMGLDDSLRTLGYVDVASRIITYGFSVPCREVLFTVVSREAKFKSKNVIDTIIIRGSDSVSSAIFAGLKTLASFSAICWMMLPLTILWIYIAKQLGQQQTQLAETVKND